MYPKSDRILWLSLYGGTKEDFKKADQAMKLFNLIAFVFHYPDIHKDFDDKLIATFKNLHHRTARDFLFFANVDPKLMENSIEAKREYYPQLEDIKRASCNMDAYDSLTLNNIAKKLDIPMNSFPCIVVFNNIKAKAYRWYKTNADNIELQLTQIGILSSRYPEMKNNWRFAGHKLEENINMFNLCDECGGGFLEEKKTFDSEGTFPEYRELFPDSGSVSDENNPISSATPPAIVPSNSGPGQNGKSPRSYGRHEKQKIQHIERADYLWKSAHRKGQPILKAGAMAQKLLDERVAVMKNGNPYTKGQIQKWISKTGQKYGADEVGRGKIVRK